MRWSLRIRLSLMMFLEFAILGAWMPVVFAYLTTSVPEGGLGFAREQAAWFHGVFYLACAVAPFVAGQIVDRWLPTQWFLAAAHFAGGLLMLHVAKQTQVGPMMTALGVYALLFTPTLALSASLCFHHLARPREQYASVRVFGSLGWIAACLGLSLWRHVADARALAVPGDMLYLSAWLSLAMGVLCCFLPHTPAAKGAKSPWAFVEALRLFGKGQFALFMALSFVAVSQLQFYYLLVGDFLEKGVGLARRNVPAATIVGQAAEVLVVALLLTVALRRLGFRKTLALGLLAWPVRYLVFAFHGSLPTAVVVGSLALHGFGYAFFYLASQLYVERVAPPDIRGSAQALLALVTMGLGSFVGSRLAGYVTERLTRDGASNWQWTFLIPCGVTLACVVVFLLLFREPPEPEGGRA